MEGKYNHNRIANWQVVQAFRPAERRGEAPHYFCFAAPKETPCGKNRPGPGRGVALWTVAGSATDKSSDWPAYSGDKGSTKYSSLDQINKDTIKSLKIAWRQSGVPDELKTLFPDAQGSDQLAEHADHGRRPSLHEQRRRHRRRRSTPATGKVVWFDVPPHDDGKRPARGGSTRGVAYWANGNDSRIFAMNGAEPHRAQREDRQALSATGARTAQVDLTKVGYDRGGVTGYRNSSGPIVVRDVVVVGGVPAPATDYLNERVKATKEAPPDDIRGFDAKTGKHLWTFHVVPRHGEFGVETWLNDSRTYSGNSGVWSLLSADEELGYVYLPIEEATGDYYGGTRPGNNLFAETHRVPRREDRQARVALPDAAPRPLGLRPPGRADSRRHHRQRPARSRRSRR